MDQPELHDNWTQQVLSFVPFIFEEREAENTGNCQRCPVSRWQCSGCVSPPHPDSGVGVPPPSCPVLAGPLSPPLRPDHSHPLYLRGPPASQLVSHVSPFCPPSSHSMALREDLRNVNLNVKCPRVHAPRTSLWSWMGQRPWPNLTPTAGRPVQLWRTDVVCSGFAPKGDDLGGGWEGQILGGPHLVRKPLLANGAMPQKSIYQLDANCSQLGDSMVNGTMSPVSSSSPVQGGRGESAGDPLAGRQVLDDVGRSEGDPRQAFASSHSL